MLQLGGYLPSTAGVEVAQPASALTAIAIGVSVVPAVLVAASLFWLRRYALDEHRPDDHPAEERSTDGG